MGEAAHGSTVHLELLCYLRLVNDCSAASIKHKRGHIRSYSSMATQTTPVALISAGSAGLGAATARLFCQNGYRIVVNYSSNADRANKLLDEFAALSSLPSSEQSNAFAAVKADLTKRDEINRLVDETVQKMGRLDVVFSNGGWTKIRDMTSIDGKPSPSPS